MHGSGDDGNALVATAWATMADEQVQAAIAASGALFRDGPVPMWLFDVETLQILAVNDAAVRAYGWSRDEFVQMTIRDLRRPDDAPADLGRMPRTGDGLVLRGPFRHRRSDGTLLDAEVHAQDVGPLPDGRLARLVVAIDVSARQLAESRERFLSEITGALARSLDFERTLERIAQLAIEHLADGCAVHLRGASGHAELQAAASRDPDQALRLRAIDRRAWAGRARSMRVGPDAVLATGRSEFHGDLTAAPDDGDELLDVWRRLGIVSCMCLPLTAPGHALPVGVLSLASTTVGRRFAALDLAMGEELARHASLAIENARLYAAERRARHRAEWLAVRHAQSQAITAALARTLTAAETADVVVTQGIAALGARAGSVAVLAEDGSALEVIQSTGYPEAVRDAYRVLPMSLHFPLTDAVRRGEAIWLANTAERDRRYPHLASLRRTNGDGAMASVPLLVEGAVLGAMGLNFPEGVTLDEEDRAFTLTLASQCAQALERARLHEAERRARAAIEAARLEAEAANRTKTEFLAVMSHELRTPLNAIAGYAELLEMGIRGPVTADQQHDLQRIRRSQQHLLGLINDVLNFAKLETGAVRYEIADLPVREVLEGVEPLIAPQLAARQLRYDFRHGPDALLVRADRDKLQQILLNLLSNAVKFTDEGGRITVSYAAYDGQVRVQVRDTGIGIPADRLESIFEPFVQLDQRLTRTTQGTGLGLAISRDLARAMGGELVVASTLGEGSEFTLLLPRGHA